jgi:chromosome segregation ATPase
MNTIGKILVVFVTASSLGFLAFVAALRTGGPDWQGELRAPEVTKDFVFETERSDVPKYTAIHRKTESKVADKKPVLAEVVLDVRKRIEQDTNNEINRLKPMPQQLQEAIKGVTDSIAADKVGVEIREQELTDRFQQLWQQLESVGDEFSKLTIETQDVMKVAQERREEGMRLSNQLQLLRNDSFAAEEQKKNLDNELIQLEENKRRLQHRQDQLKKQLSVGY